MKAGKKYFLLALFILLNRVLSNVMTRRNQRLNSEVGGGRERGARALSRNRLMGMCEGPKRTS